MLLLFDVVFFILLFFKASLKTAQNDKYVGKSLETKMCLSHSAPAGLVLNDNTQVLKQMHGFY